MLLTAEGRGRQLSASASKSNGARKTSPPKGPLKNKSRTSSHKAISTEFDHI